MVFGLFRKRENPKVYDLYNEIVAQARQPCFYMEFRVPDTIDGRFDLIVLHSVLVFHRLRREGEAASRFAQDLFDLFFKDMDRNLREMGVGDVSVPKKIKKMAEAFYGRADVYCAALDDNDADALALALDRNIFADESCMSAARMLAAYMIGSAAHLAAQDAEIFLAGKIDWPSPSDFTESGGEVRPGAHE